VAGLVLSELSISGHDYRRLWRKTKVDVMAISSALDDYAINNQGHYPKGLEALVTPDENGEAYLK
jgi:Type II secretion system (T2SS), protein G